MNDFTRRNKRRPILTFGLVAFTAALLGPWDADAKSETKTLIIGTKEAPPFAMRDANGHWTGLSIQLWKDLAADLDIPYVFEEFTLKGLLSATAEGRVDAGIAAITVTAAREATVDFSHPYHYEGLGIAIKSPPLWTIITHHVGHFVAERGLLTLIMLFFTLLVLSTIVWILNMNLKAHQQNFGPGAALGVTRTDERIANPWIALRWIFSSWAGRLVAVLWITAAFVFLTDRPTDRLPLRPVQSFDDLPGVAVGTASGSYASSYLSHNGINHQICGTISNCLDQLRAEKLVAVVYDSTILRYMATDKYESLTVLDETVSHQSYAIAIPAGSKIREALNTQLLKRLSEGTYWNDIQRDILGP